MHHDIKVYKMSWMLNPMHARCVPQMEWLAVSSGHTVHMELMQRIVLGQLKASSAQLYEVFSTPSLPAVCITYSCIRRLRWSSG